jgi:SAM-dependent methyltransferase
MTEPANIDQAQYWNSPAGRKWVDHQATMDTIMSGVLERLLHHAAPQPDERVLDIGCGTGASTFAVASAVGPGGKVTGLDISDLLLGHAGARMVAEGSGRTAFLLGDAQTHDFAPGAADLVLSRFGVMFFEDPVAAFANMRAALRSGGRVAFVTWAAIDGNPWFRVPRDAAIARLGRPAPVPPRSPGPLAFAEIDYVQGILSDAGFSDAAGVEEEVWLEHPGGLQAIGPLAANIGPAMRIANELGATEADMAVIGEAILEGFRPYEIGDGIRIPGRFNFYTGVAG